MKPTVLTSPFLVLWIACSAFGQQAVQPPRPTQATAGAAKGQRPPLFLREDFPIQEAPPFEGPMTQKYIGNPNLELKLYGERPGRNPDQGMWINVTVNKLTEDPSHTYSGTCRNPCALALRDRNNFVDLTGLAKVRWRTEISHFRFLRPLVKLADGTWLVGDYAQGYSPDYVENEFSLLEMRWLPIDIDKVLMTGNNSWVADVDLSRVDEIGFVDLAPGSASAHGGAARSKVDWIEVYGSPVPRK